MTSHERQMAIEQRMTKAPASRSSINHQSSRGQLMARNQMGNDTLTAAQKPSIQLIGAGTRGRYVLTPERL
jgi:hypothetical protein